MWVSSYESACAELADAQASNPGGHTAQFREHKCVRFSEFSSSVSRANRGKCRNCSTVKCKKQPRMRERKRHTKHDAAAAHRRQMRTRARRVKELNRRNSLRRRSHRSSVRPYGLRVNRVPECRSAAAGVWMPVVAAATTTDYDTTTAVLYCRNNAKNGVCALQIDLLVRALGRRRFCSSALLKRC